MCILWAHKRHSKVVLRQHWQWHSPTVRSHCQLCIKSLMCTKSIRTSLNILTSWFGWLSFNYKTLHERRSESISRYWHCSQHFPYLMSVEQINRYLYLELLMIPPAHARFAWPTDSGYQHHPGLWLSVVGSPTDNPSTPSVITTLSVVRIINCSNYALHRKTIAP